MASGKEQWNDAIPLFFSRTTTPIPTPPSTICGNSQPDGDSSSTSPLVDTGLPAAERLWCSHGDVPWPDNEYQIILKNTNKAITNVGDRPILLKIEDTPDPRAIWRCVEKNGYYGFQNTSSGRFVGHDGGSRQSGIRCCAYRLNKWELWVPRPHPEGGYQLLSPFWSDTLMLLCVEGDGATLARRTHGKTVWVFVRV